MTPALMEFLAKMTPGGYGIWLGVLMLASWQLSEWRKDRKLTSEDRQARREGFQKQVETLQDENRKLRADLVKRDGLHDEYRHACQVETDQLRDEIRGLEDRVTGLKRRIDTIGGMVTRAVAEGFDAPTVFSRILGELKE